jgi:hypothetical protein
MATKLQHRRSSNAGDVPATNQLALGEIAINTADGFLYIKKDDGSNPEEIFRFRGEPLSDVAVVNDTFTGDGLTTTFTLSRIPEAAEFAFVTINGVMQQTDAYSISSNTLTIDPAPETGDAVEVRTISIRTSALELKNYKSYVYTITSSTTSISGSDDYGSTLEYDSGQVAVYYNGVRLVQGPDYTANNNTTITLNSTIEDGTIEVISHSRASFVDHRFLDLVSATTASTSQELVDRFLLQNYRTAKYLIQMSQGTDYHVTEVMLLHDGTNVHISEYGTMYTNSSLGTITADISGDYVRLLVTPVNNTAMNIKGHRLQVGVN